MFRRKVRTRLPGIEDFSNWTEDQELRDYDNELKEKGKMYIDKKRGAKESDLRTDDTVLAKQKQENKLTPTFAAQPYRVTEKIGNSFTIESPTGVQYRRNTSHLNKLLERSNNDEKPTYPDVHDYTEVGYLDDTSHEGNRKDIPEIVESATRPTRDRKLMS